MFFVMLLLFGLSTADWGTFLASVIRQIRGLLIENPEQPLQDKFDIVAQSILHFNIAGVYLSMFSYLVGDAFVVWRAWVLCAEYRKAAMLPIVLLTCALAITLVTTTFERNFLLTGSNHSRLIVRYTQGVIIMLEFFANVAATLLIARVAWLQRELIDTRLKLVPKMRTRKLVMLVIESGVLLWIVWILLIIFQYGVDNGTVPGNLFTASSIQLIAMHVTAVIVLLARKSTVWDLSDTPGPDTSQTVSRFAAAPGRARGVSASVSVSRQHRRSQPSVIQLRSARDTAARAESERTTGIATVHERAGDGVGDEDEDDSENENEIGHVNGEDQGGNHALEEKPRLDEEKYSPV